MKEYKNFIKLSDHFYSAENQNGFNNSLYDFFKSMDYNISKKEIRDCTISYPTYYPCAYIIIDKLFELNQIDIELVKGLNDLVHSGNFYLL